MSAAAELSAFFWQFLCYSQSDDHPQEDLAQNQAKSEKPIFFTKKSSIFLATLT